MIFSNKFFKIGLLFVVRAFVLNPRMRAGRQVKGTHWLRRLSNEARRLLAFLFDFNSYQRRIYARVECRSVFSDL